jgi:hypothetical protein
MHTRIFMSCYHNVEERHSIKTGIFFKYDEIEACGNDSNEAEIYSKQFGNVQLRTFTFRSDI